MTFGRNVERLLGSRDKAWLARRLGVTPTMAGRWIEADNVTLTTLLRVAVALEVPVELLVAGTNVAYDAMREAAQAPTQLHVLVDLLKPDDHLLAIRWLERLIEFPSRQPEDAPSNLLQESGSQQSAR